MKNFQYNGFVYSSFEDVEPEECTKIFHSAIKDGKEIQIDFSPYSQMDYETFQMIVDLNFPKRISCCPLDRDSVLKLWIENK